MFLTVKGMRIHVSQGEEGFVTLESEGPITIVAASAISVTAPSVNIGGNLSVSGDITANGSIVDGGGNTPHHSH